MTDKLFTSQVNNNNNNNNNFYSQMHYFTKLHITLTQNMTTK